MRESIRIEPNFVDAHDNLAIILAKQGKLDQAIAAWREVIRRKPNHAGAHINIAGVLRAQGDFAGSLAMYRKVHELGSKLPGWRYPSAEWVREAERLAVLDGKRIAFLKGEFHPSENAERLAVADLCGKAKHFAAAARLFAEAIESDPKLGDDLPARHRHNAAGLAALAGAGQGADDPRPDEAARNQLRRQARAWFRADLDLCAKKLETGDTSDRAVVVKELQHWKECGDLAAARDPEALAKVPEAERKEWEGFWREVESLLKRTRGEGP